MKESFFLTGFMGAGKSTVGRILAQRLNRKFIDTDLLIEEKLGKSIEDIFSIYGEERFRDEETKIILELVLKEEEPVVVALGGGAVVRDVNRKILFQSNRVKLINLRAGPRELYRRLKNKEDRPLLKQGNPYTVIKDLLEARKKFYDTIPCQINTEGLTPEEVVEQICHIFIG
ncbi:MAG: shikimate kinase [Firmicutes bacterium]|nr:shikimate kinase [Bacillota bacterium]